MNVRLLTALVVILSEGHFAVLAQQPRIVRPRSSVELVTFPKPAVTAHPTNASTAAEPVEYNGPCNYLSYLRRKVLKAWLPPKTTQTLTTKVVFTVAKDGKVSNAHVLESSGNMIADGEALTAIERASPFLPLPERCPATVDFEFTFARRVSAPSVRGSIVPI